MADAKAGTSRRATGAKSPRGRKAKPAVKAVARNRGAGPASAGGARETGIQGAVEMATKTNGASAFAAADQFTSAFAEVNERSRAAFEKGARLVEEFADLTRGNVEALVASTKVAAKGAETLGQDAAEFGRKAFEEASSALRGFAEAKSATDFFKLQSDYARSAFDAAIAESARVSEAMLKIAGEVAAPISSRYAVAAERVKSFAA